MGSTRIKKIEIINVYSLGIETCLTLFRDITCVHKTNTGRLMSGSLFD